MLSIKSNREKGSSLNESVRLYDINIKTSCTHFPSLVEHINIAKAFKY